MVRVQEEGMALLEMMQLDHQAGTIQSTVHSSIHCPAVLCLSSLSTYMESMPDTVSLQRQDRSAPQLDSAGVVDFPDYVEVGPGPRPPT